MNTPDSGPEEDPPTEPIVAGPLLSAENRLRGLVRPEAEPLLTALGHIEAALLQSVEGHTVDVRRHCEMALLTIDEIEHRHDVSMHVVECLDAVRDDIDTALQGLQI